MSESGRKPLPVSTFATLQGTARRVGRYQWMEIQCFELLGRWVANVPEITPQLMLGSHCYHHSWHAELWMQRLPELREMNADHLVEPPSAAVSELFDALHGLTDPGQTIERLVGVYRVLIPYKVSTYADHLAQATVVADAPVIRALNLALADELADWREGERVLQQLLTSPEMVQRAAAAHARFETLICGLRFSDDEVS